MRKPTWWDLGIAMLGLVLVCGAVQGTAQAPDPEGSVGDVTQDSRITGTSDGMGSGQGLTTGGTAQTGTGGSGTGQATEAGTGGTGTGQATATGQGTELEAQQRLELARLRAQVAGLEQQLAQMRVQLARTQEATRGVGGSGQGVGGSGQAGVSGQGVGGSGTASVGEPNAEAPQGASGIGYASAEGVGGGGSTGGAADTTNEGYAVVNVILTGRVRSVNPQQLVLDLEGGFSNTLSLAKDVRVTRKGQQVPLRNLSEGTLVRTSADLYARGNPVTSIEVLSAPAGSGK